MKIRSKITALMSLKLTAITFLLLTGVFIFQSCSTNEYKYEEDTESTELRTPPGYEPNELYCEYTCLRGGFSVTVWKNDNYDFQFVFTPINTIYVNHDFHTNNATAIMPYPYNWIATLGVYPNNGTTVDDAFGNPIVGMGYHYSFVGSNILNRCNQAYSTAFVNLQGNDPCNEDVALFYLNNSQNKTEDCELICPSGGFFNVDDFIDPTYDLAPNPLILTNKYGKLCKNVPGFCFIDVNDPPVNEPFTDPLIHSTVYTRADDFSIKLKFFGELEVQNLEISEENNRLDSKVLFKFGFPSNTTIASGSYPVITSDEGDDFGYCILKLEFE